MISHQKLRVLIAEDDYMVSQMVRGLLESGGHQVIGEAINGTEAVALTQSLRPDVVVMDVSMPEMDGIEATRQIQTICPTPVVMLTAYDEQELVQQASQAGAGAYILKPPDLQEIERAISIAVARFDDLVEMRRLNAELQARNEDLDAFAQTVAHDLQSSISMVISLSETLRAYQTTISEADMERFLLDLVQQGQTLSNIVHELLILASVRQQDVVIQPLDMADIIASAEKRLLPIIQEKEGHITVETTWHTALGHAPWIEEVWFNYLSNGLKYGGNPPQIRVGSTAQSDGTVRFWVHDNGNGLPDNQQAQLFQPYTRLNQIHTKGQGLGLSIVRRIIGKLGGKVGVESKDIPGGGCLFYFTLQQAHRNLE